MMKANELLPESTSSLPLVVGDSAKRAASDRNNVCHKTPHNVPLEFSQVYAAMIRLDAHVAVLREALKGLSGGIAMAQETCSNGSTFGVQSLLSAFDAKIVAALAQTTPKETL